MTNRIIDVSEPSAHISVQNDLLTIKSSNAVAATAPLSEVAALVLSGAHGTITGAVLAGVSEHGGIIVVCDAKHQPVGMILPLDTHFIQSERFIKQAAASLPVRKKVWKKIVTAKISAQAEILTSLKGSPFGLHSIAKRVQSGDSGNAEAVAAQRYWTALFGKAFSRMRGEGDINGMLNYGYAVLRAIVARSACAAGLHPGLGIHHHNRYDPFPLASDLMEPFRPIIDKVVVAVIEKYGADAILSPEIKKHILSPILADFKTVDGNQSLFTIANRLASSLTAVYEGKRNSIVIPKIQLND